LTTVSLVSPTPIWINGKRVIPITDVGVAQLDLKHVVNLSLDGPSITDACLKSLPNMPSLRSCATASDRMINTTSRQR
jgi:hypothetical protein